MSLLGVSMLIEHMEFRPKEFLQIWDRVAPSSLKWVRELEALEALETCVCKMDQRAEEAVERASQAIGSGSVWNETSTQLCVKMCGGQSFSHAVLFLTWLWRRRPDVIESIAKYASKHRQHCGYASVMYQRMQRMVRMQSPDGADARICRRLFGTADRLNAWLDQST